ncbi:two component transcriptional regulator, LytTR family [Lachnospiraceae bacterium XBB1006]|nr:two component transcriptional regulator, LytTR family [Lachnospiraceae bacterium XBB1006]
MEYKIAICDDEAAEREYITGLVKNWAGERSIQVETFPSGESFLFHYEEVKDYDILLLDIEMEGLDGVSLARRIRKENETVQIVFITGYSEYISEGYEVAALHYLMKPVKEEKFYEVLNRAVHNLAKNEKSLLLNQGGESVRVPLFSIRYLEVQLNYVTVHAGEEITVKKTLGEFEEELDQRFYRLGRSYIVNLTQIYKISKKEVFLKDGTVLPLPRGQYEKLNRAFIERL